jgi:hypothetical protein
MSEYSSDEPEEGRQESWSGIHLVKTLSIKGILGKFEGD